MRTRTLLLTVAMLLTAACGTDDPIEETSPTEKPSTTETVDDSTTTTEDGPSTTEKDSTTTTDSDLDLAQALPEVSDLPSGFSETEPSDDSDDEGTTYDASPECEALIERLEGTELTEGGEKKAFANEDSVELEATIKVPTEEELTAFEELVNFLGDCDSFTAHTTDGASAEVTVASEPVDLGDKGLIADLEFDFSDGGRSLQFGATLVAVLHHDVLFTVELADGLGDTLELTKRDKQLAEDVAAVVNEKLNELMGD